MESLKIIVVEDNESHRLALEKNLQSYDYEVHGHAHGEEAVLQLERESFDILVTDLRMPGMNGFELIRRAKLFRSGLKTILMTGLEDKRVEEKVVEEGIDGLFYKPIDLEKLLGFLDFVSESKRRQHQLSPQRAMNSH